MSALLDEFRSVLSSYRDEVATWVNQGLIVSVDEHLKRLEAAAPAVEADAKAAVHQILTDLYTAWHAPAEEPAATPAAGVVMVGEPGPETVSLPDSAPMAAATAVPAEEPADAAEPETDTPAPTES